MPSVQGLSLRRALAKLQPYGVEVLVHGAGRVVEQRPAAGHEVSGGQVVLRLGHQRQDTARQR